MATLKECSRCLLGFSVSRSFSELFMYRSSPEMGWPMLAM